MVLQFRSHSHRVWLRNGFVAGAIVGASVASWLYWYYEHGPGLANPDRGDAHGLLIIPLGFPFSLLAQAFPDVLPAWAGHAYLVFSAACTVGIIFAIVTGIAWSIVQPSRSAT